MSDWRIENSAKNWAMAYDFPAVKDKRVVLEEFPQRDRGIMRAFAFNTAARQVQGSEGATRVQFRLRLRGDEQAVLLRPIQAGQQLLRGHRAGLFRPAAGRGAQDPGSRCATRSRPRSSPPRMPTRSPAHPRTCALICARGCGFCAEAGYEVRDHKQVNVRTGEVLSVEILGLTSDPLRSGTLHPLLQALHLLVSVSTSACEVSTMCNTRIVYATSTSISS